MLEWHEGALGLAGVAAQADALAIAWRNGDSAHIPFLWLRHNCRCDDCVIRQTAEKRFRISTVERDIRPSAATIDDEGTVHETVTIRWPDGHRSTFPSGDLAELLHPPRRQLRYWDARFEPCRFGFDEFLASDQIAAAMIEEFLTTGACILTDGPTEPNSVERLVPRLGPVRETLFERIHNVVVDPAGYNIAHTLEDVPPHNDMVSYTWPPSVQALHMLVNDCTGGESVFVDGFAVAQRLRRELPCVFETLCAVQVPFSLFSAKDVTYAVNPMIELDSAGHLKLLRFSNQTMLAMPLSEPRLDDFYRAYYELDARVNDAHVQASSRLEAGEILLTAAHRVLHGRKPIKGAGRRHLQDAYFEHDNVRNHLAALVHA